MLKKLGLQLSKKEIEGVVGMEPDAVEKILIALKYHIDQYSVTKKSQRSLLQHNSNVPNAENQGVRSNLQFDDFNFALFWGWKISKSWLLGLIEEINGTIRSIW